MDRYYRAAHENAADTVVRVTSDCPLIDPQLVDETVEVFRDGHADYGSNVFPRTYPRGLDTEVFTVAALDRAWSESREPYQREHVTPYLYEHPQIFRQASKSGDMDYSHYRWTLDTREDMDLLHAIYRHFDGCDDFSWREVVAPDGARAQTGRAQFASSPEIGSRALMPPATLVLRADASIAMGTGHVMRCLALAQAWQDQGGECIFAMAESTEGAEERIRREKFEVIILAESPGSPQDAERVVELALARHAAWVVLDGYQFEVEHQRRLKAAGVKLLVVDDTAHVGAYAADLVLDQNAHATEDFYARRESYTQLLLGPRYALLRREFKPWRELEAGDRSGRSQSAGDGRRF